MVVDLKEFELQKEVEEKQEIAIKARNEFVDAVMRYASYRLMREVHKGE